VSAADPYGRVLPVDELPALVAGLRGAGDRLVLTNGCFDVLHAGHVHYLAQARELGDRLIVGVNSDESVRALKGPDRPLNPADDRARVLAALSSVDVVSVFGDLTPERLIRIVEPDVYVKGGDYADGVPEHELVTGLGGRVEILDLVPGRSTTELLERVRSTRGEG
jgi:rfaE bifunctional protein nucleotidyltransferase chain/domain